MSNTVPKSFTTKVRKTVTVDNEDSHSYILRSNLSWAGFIVERRDDADRLGAKFVRLSKDSFMLSGVEDGETHMYELVGENVTD